MDPEDIELKAALNRMVAAAQAVPKPKARPAAKKRPFAAMGHVEARARAHPYVASPVYNDTVLPVLSDGDEMSDDGFEVEGVLDDMEIGHSVTDGVDTARRRARRIG